MSTKMIGGLGVLKVSEYFIRKGFSVFGELLCDNSEVDIIVLIGNNAKKIQVRTTSSKMNKVELRLQCTTPGTRKTSCKVRGFTDVVDMFALYVIDKDVILFIDREELKNTKEEYVLNFQIQ